LSYKETINPTRFFKRGEILPERGDNQWNKRKIIARYDFRRELLLLTIIERVAALLSLAFDDHLPLANT